MEKEFAFEISRAGRIRVNQDYMNESEKTAGHVGTKADVNEARTEIKRNVYPDTSEYNARREIQ